MITLEPIVEAHIKVHARKEYPRESCGVITIENGKQVYRACKNDAVNKDEHFIIDPKDYMAADEAGEIIAIVHSHPAISVEPSEPDKVWMSRTKLPWVIVNWPVGNIGVFYPEGEEYIPPLVGRKFNHGVIDCYSIVRDYFKLELGVTLPEHERKDDWWDKGQNLYLDNYEADGWILVNKEDMKKNDMIYMRIRSKVPNHAAIYLGDNIILHHLTNRLSSRDVYGGFYMKNTTHVLRHKSQC